MKKEDMITKKLKELQQVTEGTGCKLIIMTANDNSHKATVLLNGNACDLVNMMASLLEKIALDTGCSQEELLIALLMGGDHHGC
ncbi:hypothetical protein [Megasphaera elsdenii]|uniref:hypothetical protein n=1 Tax=Megasphaera elsdenii TaxID=907 RepID=UPI00352294C0